MDAAAASLDWHEALDSYRYPVDLRKFSGRDRFPGWFDQNLTRGDQTETAQFEAHFRKCAAAHLEPWYEVVFWKMYSQSGRADLQTERTIKRILNKKTSANTLWRCCTEYLQSESKKSFRQFQQLL